MSPKIKNILIFVIIAVVLLLAYFLFIKPGMDQGSQSTLVTTTQNSGTSNNLAASTADSNGVAKDFLTLLLSVKSIKLDDSIFSDIAFSSLRDSTIVLVPDGTEGRPNPFAKLGADPVTPVNNPAPVTAPITPIVPPPTNTNPPAKKTTVNTNTTNTKNTTIGANTGINTIDTSPITSPLNTQN